MNTENFQSGFVNILGLPNVGKSSLINFLIDEPLSIINSKSQTTRQNIKGFIHEENLQIILVDTPGFIDEPAYQLQISMNSYIELGIEEADIIILVVDKYNLLENDHPLLQAISQANKKTFLVLNKIDQSNQEEVDLIFAHYDKLFDFYAKIPISVESKLGKKAVLDLIKKELPIHPPYFNTEDFTDRDMRFFASEIIREKIFTSYQKEIPYSSEVVITKYQEKADSHLIEATIFVERESQKAIIIGHQAEKLKKISMDARKAIESYVDTKVHLFIFVKVLENWRSKDTILERLGYHIPKKVN